MEEVLAMSGGVSTLKTLLIKFVIASILVALLPTSPFNYYMKLTENISYLEYVNWFLPIDSMLAILQAWLLAITTYYGLIYIINLVGLTRGSGS